MFYFFHFHLLFTPYSLKSGLYFKYQSTAHIITGTRDRAEEEMPRNGPVQNLACYQNVSTEFIKSICAYRLCLLSQKRSQAGPGNLFPSIPFSLGTSLTALPSLQGSSLRVSAITMPHQLRFAHSCHIVQILLLSLFSSVPAIQLEFQVIFAKKYFFLSHFLN